MKTLNVAIAGLGRTGWRNHALELKKMPDRFQITAVSDLDPQRRQEASDTFGCRCFETVDALIEEGDSDILVIATPSHLHKDQAIAAMRKGKSVLCEKPMATSLAEADAMIAVAQEAGVLLSVFHNNHYAQDFQHILSVIRSGKLGRIVQIRSRWNTFGRRWDWQTLKKFGGGHLNNTGPHPFEQIVTFLDGREPQTVFCHLERAVSAGDAEDHVKVVLKTRDRPIIDLEISSADAVLENKWTVLGTTGGLTGGARELKLRYFDPASLPEREATEQASPDRSYNSENIDWKEESWQAADDAPSMPVAFYSTLHEAITEGRQPDISADHARKVIALTERCRESAE